MDMQQIGLRIEYMAGLVKGHAEAIGDMLGEMQAVLRGAMGTSIDDHYTGDYGNVETMCYLIILALEDVSALKGLGAGVLNVDCPAKP